MFSQCQSILARTLLPCQDTPLVKFTYSADVRVAEPFKNLRVLMSANESSYDESDGTFKFKQTTKIPSYLIAIGVGNLASQQVGPRSRVWSEPELLEAASYEFERTEQYLEAAESLLGPYVWSIYDILVLPPSFPYGGMENPCLTFVTPSLLAGDRSLVSVVIHEITHSWTGNLVTNASWVVNLFSWNIPVIAYCRSIFGSMKDLPSLSKGNLSEDLRESLRESCWLK